MPSIRWPTATPAVRRTPRTTTASGRSTRLVPPRGRTRPPPRPALAPPAAPSNLIATAYSPTQINLAWTDNATNETGFTIQRSANSNFTGVTTITLNAVDQVAYSNTGRAANTTYYYRVRAFNADGFSAWSNTASATTPPAIPAVPADLTVTATAGQPYIAWTYTSNGAPGPITFTVQRSNTGAGGWTTVATDITPSTFTNTGLPANVIRFYRVRAVNAAGNSAWTTPVSGTTFRRQAPILVHPSLIAIVRGETRRPTPGPASARFPRARRSSEPRSRTRRILVAAFARCSPSRPW